METIKIAHLYYDLMNLYGEHGNILVLTHHLEEHHIKVITHYLSIEDKIDFNHYDLFYIGSGSNPSFKLVLKELMTHQNEIKECMKEKKFFLITGNALDFFGKMIHFEDGSIMNGLGILDYETFMTPFRIVGEQTLKFSKINEEVIGFENRASILKEVHEETLFTVKNGTGYAPKVKEEGIHKSNFFGTYLLGPILVRNPYLTEYLVSLILKKKNLEYQYIDCIDEVKAYHEYQKNLLGEEKED